MLASVGDYWFTISVVVLIVVVTIIVIAIERITSDAPARPTTLEQKAAYRGRLMEHLYKWTDGNPASTVRMSKLRRELGWSRATLRDVCDFLDAAGLIERTSPAQDPEAFTRAIQAFMYGTQRIQLTAAGVVEVEEWMREPDEPTEHLPSRVEVTQVFHGDLRDVAIQVATDRSEQTFARDSVVGSWEDIEMYLAEYRQRLPALPANDRSIAEAQIVTADAQLRSPKPNSKILGEAISTLRSIAEGMAGSAAFAGLIEFGKSLHL
jgi:hypothetical protein